MKKILPIISCIVLAVSCLFNSGIPIHATEEEPIIQRADMPVELQNSVGRLISYYAGGYKADVVDQLTEMKSLSSKYHEIWNSIINYWDWIERDMVENIGAAPDGIERPEKHAFIVLGFALNNDGTMTDELIGRLQVAKASALKYPDSYILVTGGVEKNGWTEGRRMRDWLIDNGISANKIIVEEKAPDTAGNATNSFEMLYKDYDVESASLITSQYHLKRGSILYYTESLLKAYELGVPPIKFIGEANAGWYRSDKTSEDLSLKAMSLRLVANVPSINISSSILTGIEITGQSKYIQGDPLNISVKSKDTKNYQVDLTSYALIRGYDANRIGEQDIKAEYVQGGKAYEANFKITVEKTPDEFIDRAKLENLVTVNLDRDINAYTRRSTSYFEKGLQAAIDLLKNPQASQEDFIQAYNQLNQSVARLVALENVAVNKSVEANYNQKDAYKVTDNIIATNNYWASMNGSANAPIDQSNVIIDLGENNAIDTIKVYPYWGGNARYYLYDVYVSTDKNDWTKVAEERDEVFCTSVGNTHRLNEVVNARYVKIQGYKVFVTGRPDINNFHLIEAQVFGEQIDPAYEQALQDVNTAIKNAEALNKEDYSQVSWDKFMKSVENMNLVITQNPTIEEMQEALHQYQLSYDHYILGTKGHHATKIDEVLATCTKTGNITYWICDDCGRLYLDEALSKEITIEDTVIKVQNHDIHKVEAKAPTCTSDGNIAYWQCTTCDKVFKDEALTSEITLLDTVLKATDHDIVKVDAKAATIDSAGNIAYWYCRICNTYYRDAALTLEIQLSDTLIKSIVNESLSSTVATGDTQSPMKAITLLSISAGILFTLKKKYKK